MSHFHYASCLQVHSMALNMWLGSPTGLFRLLLICGLLEIPWGWIAMCRWWQWVPVISSWDANFFKYSLIALGHVLFVSVQVVVARRDASYVPGFLYQNLVLSLPCLEPTSLAGRVLCVTVVSPSRPHSVLCCSFWLVSTLPQPFLHLAIKSNALQDSET